MVLVVVYHAVANDGHVAVTQFVILFDEVLLVFFVSFWCELLRFQERAERTGLVCLGEDTLFEQSTLDFREFEVVVAVDEDIAYLHLVFLVDIYIEYDLVFLSHVVSLHDVYLGVFVTFVVEIFLCENFGSVDHVRSDLRPLHDAELRLHVLPFRLLDAVIVDVAHPWAESKVEAKVYFRANERVCRYANLREESMSPVSFHSFCDFLSGHTDFLTDGKSRESSKHVVLVSLDAFYRYSADGTSSWSSGVRYFRIDYNILCFCR